MTPQKLGQMSEVMRVLYEREFQAVAASLAEESELRRQLSKLDEQIDRNQAICTPVNTVQTAAAHLLWLGWTSRTRRRLNNELARVMAKKLKAMDRVRVAFGRQHAVEMMQSNAREEQQSRRRKQQEVNTLSHRLSSATFD